MTNLAKQNTALILIDIQKGFDKEEHWGDNRNNKHAEKNCAILLKKWRELKLPIFHIQHSSDNPQSPLHKSQAGFAIKNMVQPIDGEPVIEKNVNSAFIGTDLQQRLTEQKINNLVIVGLTTNHCVSTTTRMAGNFGFNVWVVSDATATFDRVGANGEKFSAETIHQTALASLHDEFAEIMTTEQILANV
ncbi:MAG: cysteine hydrolase [Moraxellaceae bacterium]|nr:cysteine hydrolase [Moraxellaceae bacterium]